MIIVPSKRVIFVHLPKCGGTSVESAYRKACRYDDIIIIDGAPQKYYKERLGLTKHSTVKEIHGAIGQEAYSRMAVFALVRCPYNVYESFYTFTANIFGNTSKRLNLPLATLKEKALCGTVDLNVSNMPWGKAYAESGSFSEFMQYFVANEKPIRRSAFDQLGLDDEALRPKHLYKLEEIDKFWPAFSTAAGVEIRPHHINRSPKEGLVWEKNHIEFVNEIHEQDFIHFNYPFK